jgi:hypothetical protein
MYIQNKKYMKLALLITLLFINTSPSLTFPQYNNVSTYKSTLENSQSSSRILTSNPRQKGFKVRETSQIIPNAVYCIRALHSNKSLVSSNNKMELYHSNFSTCSHMAQFKFIKVNSRKGNNIFKIQSVFANKFVTVVGHKTYLQRIHLFANNQGTRQQWKLLKGKASNSQRGAFHFQNMFNNYLMDVEAGSHGHAKMITWWNPHKYGNQTFYIELMHAPPATSVMPPPPSNNITMRKSGFKVRFQKEVLNDVLYCIRAKHSGLLLAPSTDGKTLRQSNHRKCSRELAFEFVRDQTIRNKFVFYIGLPILFKYVSVLGRPTTLQNVELRETMDKNVQKWEMEKSNKKSTIREGVFHFKNLGNNHYLDVFYGNKTAIKMVTYPGYKYDHQSYFLEVFNDNSLSQSKNAYQAFREYLLGYLK